MPAEVTPLLPTHCCHRATPDSATGSTFPRTSGLSSGAGTTAAGRICQRVLPTCPSRSVIDEMNEGKFWELYELSSRPSLDRCIPLLLLQAILFAASPFVSQSTLQSLGHANSRSMRIALLRRAKLLSDLEVESSPTAIAQASVLLSTASVSSSGRLNTIWLSLAIENAMVAEAHIYST
ncbi:hypothetical protein BJX65DRAFT_282886 [Aspergillus insuetus]